MSRTWAGVALTLTLALAACGGGNDADPAPEPAPTPPPPRETVQRLPELPHRWKPYINRVGGFAIGLPPGWAAKDRGRASLVRSFDRLVAVSISPDRSENGLEVGIEEFATRTAAALPGFRRELETSGSLRYGHRYAATKVRAEGTARGGVDQAVSVIVLRRDRMATFTIVLAANAKPASRASRHLAKRVIATLRSRPPREKAKR